MGLFSAKEEIKLAVEGMHCQKCVARVQDALAAVEGVTDVVVTLEENEAVATGHGMNAEALVEAVKALGFGAEAKA